MAPNLSAVLPDMAVAMAPNTANAESTIELAVSLWPRLATMNNGTKASKP